MLSAMYNGLVVHSHLVHQSPEKKHLKIETLKKTNKENQNLKMFISILFASDRLLLFVLYKLMRNPILFCSVAHFSMLCQRSEISASHQSCVVYPLSFFIQWWGDRSAMITMVRCTCHIPQVATLESTAVCFGYAYCANFTLPCGNRVSFSQSF